MANPIVVIMSVAGVIGVGATASTVNASLSEPVNESPVVVTVEGPPVIVDGGVKKVVNKDDSIVSPKQVANKNKVDASVVVVPVPDAAVLPPTVVAPPDTNTGASGSGEYEDEEEYEEPEFEDEYESEEYEEYDEEED